MTNKAKRLALWDKLTKQGFKKVAVFKGEYVLFEDPNVPFSMARLYDNGDLWLKDLTTGEYEKKRELS